MRLYFASHNALFIEKPLIPTMKAQQLIKYKHKNTFSQDPLTPCLFIYFSDFIGLFPPILAEVCSLNML